ncbi:MAG: glycosyltransferase family 4 protein [Patescibacteria group bacterium]|jgi:glycosyltransferase involved in cell wall biosynthesis
MNISYIQNMRFPTEKAHGYQIAKTCEALAKAGAKVQLCVTDRSKNTIDPFEHYQVERVFDLLNFPVFDLVGKTPLFLNQAAFLIERWTFLRSIKKDLDKQADVYYTRDTWIAPKLKKITDKPVYLELHSMPSNSALKKLGAVDGILCVTKWMESEVKKQLPNMRTYFLPDSVDLAIFDPELTRQQARKELRIPEQTKIIVYGGRFSTMEKGKGLSQLDQAVAEIAKKIPDLACYMVGGTAQDFYKVESREPSPTTQCLKSVDRPTLALYYRSADVLAMPFPNSHHYAYEMSPLKLFEYMASGTPIVTSDLPSVREIVDENSAYFFEAENSSALVQALTQALGDAAGSASKASDARQKVQAFTWANRAKQILNFVS